MAITGVQPLDDQITLHEAADLLGVSTQAAYKWAEQGRFDSLRKLGSKKVYCVKRTEVERIRKARDNPVKRPPEKLPAKNRHELARRVRYATTNALNRADRKADEYPDESELEILRRQNDTLRRGMNTVLGHANDVLDA